MRKVLSFVLVLTLVLSSFSMAFAATPASGLTDIAGNPHADAIQVCYDLGIITGNPDGTFGPDKIVNRAEFAAMLTRALNIPDSALAGYTATTFKDCAGYSWAVPYLAFCQSKGIMLGDGAGNVFPGRTITVNEAMTMALRAIGYTANSSLLVGAWPSNYVSIAQNSDMYDDVTAETTLNKAIAAQIIYNLLTVQKVSVNSDGTTDYLWDGKEADGVEANLLNTNLNCTADEDVILGDDYDYEDAIINITNDLGAYGTAYLNSDDELVAFTKDSTALTGSVNDDGDFEVGDVTYEFGDNTFTNAASYAAIANSESKTTTAGGLTSGAVASFAAVYADDADTVTLNVDLSGKKIKDVYSVVAWKADDADLAASDVQDSITDDHELLTGAFVEDDDDNIDLKSFALAGVASLDKIAEDNVVAVYLDDNDDIRKVTVGTETLTGAIDEINTDGDELTIADKEYDVSSLKNADTFSDSDVDSDGTFYLDVDGAVFNFDGTAKADTYGVVKASESGDSFNNMKIKLYTSEDSTKTLYLSEDDPYDIDWTTTGATATLVTAGAAGVSEGALIGYSLDSDGNIDTIDNTVVSTASIVFKSAKVLGTETIASNCVVFTYNLATTAAFGSFGAFGGDSADFDVASLKDIDADTNVASATQPAFYILNDDGDVAALFISDEFADTESDAIYGVINGRTATTTDGDDVYKFTGFIDGTAFTYKTDDRGNDGNHVGGYNGLAGVFGVYAITLDGSNAITKINDLTTAYSAVDDSGIIDSGIIADLGSDNTVVTIGTTKTVVADDAVVYKYDTDDEEFVVSKLSAIDEGDTIALYDTKGEDDVDGIATVVIFYEN